MPNFVALEICDDKLLVACAKSASGGLQVQQLFELETSDLETDSEIGAALKAMLADKGVGRSEVIGVVGRHEAEIREVSVPPAPDNELPDLVRFQARNVFASLSDSWQLDYVPFERSPGEEQQRVLAAAIAPQVRQRFEDISEELGQKLKRIVFRPFALTHLFERHTSSGNSNLLVVPNGSRFDIAVTVGETLVVTRSFQSGPDQSAEVTHNQLIGEIRRTIASTNKALAGKPDKILVGCRANKFENFETELSSKVDVPVTFVEPTRCLSSTSLTAPEVPQDSERYAALMGALVREFSNQKQVIDFKNPRKPVVKKRDFSKVLIGIGVVALLFLVAAFVGWNMLSKQSALIAKKQKERDELRSRNDGNGNRPGVARIIGEVTKLDRWKADKVNWLDELAWVSEKTLTPDDVQVSRFRGVEKSEGFTIDLTSRMTKEKSQDSSWKEQFEARYQAFFGTTTEDTKNKELPVSRPFTLTCKSDLEKTIDEISEIAYQNQEKAFAEEYDAEPEPENESEDNDTETASK